DRSSAGGPSPRLAGHNVSRLVQFRRPLPTLPDTPWVDEQAALEYAEELNVTVAAEQEGLLTTVEQTQEVLVRRRRQDHVVERRRRAVKAEDVSAANLKLDLLLKSAYER